MVHIQKSKSLAESNQTFMPSISHQTVPNWMLPQKPHKQGMKAVAVVHTYRPPQHRLLEGIVFITSIWGDPIQKYPCLRRTLLDEIQGPSTLESCNTPSVTQSDAPRKPHMQGMKAIAHPQPSSWHSERERLSPRGHQPVTLATATDGVLPSINPPF